MIRNFSKEILDLHGRACQEGQLTVEVVAAILKKVGEDYPDAAIAIATALQERQIQPLTFASAVCGALVDPLPGDESSLLKAKTERMKLAMRIFDGGDVHLTSDEMTIIKERVNKRFHGAVVPFRVSELLDSEPKLSVAEKTA